MGLRQTHQGSISPNFVRIVKDACPQKKTAIQFHQQLKHSYQATMCATFAKCHSQKEASHYVLAKK
jgi:hypothetical protein